MTLARIARQISSASTAPIGLVMTTAVAQTSGAITTQVSADASYTP